MSLSTLLPLIAAIIYAIGALIVKRAAELGVGSWRTAFIANLVGAVVFLPLILVEGTNRLDLWWQPVIAGLVFTVGQSLTFTAMDKGDVSVATPVLGLKILFVALLVTFIAGQSLRPQLWLAALLATAGIALLNFGGGHPHHHVARTIVTAALAAAMFAIFDALVQAWAAAWGAARFVSLTIIAAAVCSLAFVPRFRAPLSAIPRPAWRWLLGGTTLMAAQSLMFVFTVAHWRNAATANIVYSSRGLWSVVLVWLFGHWVKSREQHLGRSTLSWRLSGATLMMAAIFLAVR